MIDTGYKNGVYQGGDIRCGTCGVLIGTAGKILPTCAWFSARAVCKDCNMPANKVSINNQELSVPDSLMTQMIQSFERWQNISQCSNRLEALTSYGATEREWRLLRTYNDKSI